MSLKDTQTQVREAARRKVIDVVDRRMLECSVSRRYYDTQRDENGDRFFQYSCGVNFRQTTARLYVDGLPPRLLVIQKGDSTNAAVEDIKRDLGDKVNVEYLKGTGTCK